MLRLLTDENFNGDIIRGLLLREPDLDLVRVQDVGLAGNDDQEILAWAAENDASCSRTTEPPCRTSAPRIFDSRRAVHDPKARSIKDTQHGSKL